jgi:hypothetical protein
MATAKQIAANRLNSQKNTGPRTARGKAASRFNALKHGIYAVHQIMFDEKPEDLAELSAEYHEHHSPADPNESLLVDALVHNEWRLRRMRRVEAGLWQRAHDLFIVKNLDTTTTCTSAEAFATDSATFERLQRVVGSCERVYHRAHKEFVVARAHGLGAPQPQAEPVPVPTPQSEQSKTTSTSSASVHTLPDTPPPAAPKPPDAAPPAPHLSSPLVGQHAPASPADTWPRPTERFPDPMEYLDAALQAISRQSSPDL